MTAVALWHSLPSLGRWDVVRLWCNFAGALFCGCVAFRTARTEPFNGVRRRFYALSVFAALYVCIYGCVLLGPFAEKAQQARMYLSIVFWFVIAPMWPIYRARRRWANVPKSSEELAQIIGGD